MLNTALRRLAASTLRKNVQCSHLTATRAQSTATETAPASIRATYTSETDARKHNLDHEGMFYVLPQEAYDRLFKMDGFNKFQMEMINYLKETAILIRKPALEIINFLERTDFNKPVTRYVICTFNCSCFMC